MTTSTGEGKNDAPATTRRRVPVDTFATRLRIARIYAGDLTVRDAAERCGLNYGSWSNWENGAKPRDLLDVVGRISEGLDIDEHWLLFGGPLAQEGGHRARFRPNDRSGVSPVQAAHRPRTAPTRPKGRPANASSRPQSSAPPTRRRPTRIDRPGSR